MSVPAHAQSWLVGGGAKAGFISAELSSDDALVDEFHGDPRVGFVAGGYVALRLTDLISFQPELLFVQKGASGTGVMDGETLFLDYVEAPLLLNVGFGTARPRPFLVTGLAPSLNVKASIRLAEQVEGADAGVDQDDYFKAFDLAWVVGGGFQTRRFTVEARYTFGLIRIDEDILGARGGIKTRALAALIGIDLSVR